MNILLVSSHNVEERESTPRSGKRTPKHFPPEILNTLEADIVVTQLTENSTASACQCPVSPLLDHSSEIASALSTVDLTDIESHDVMFSVAHGLVNAATDTPDSALSSADTISSYSGSSVGGAVIETFTASFDGLPEGCGSEKDENDECDVERDSAVHVDEEDGSLNGSVASGNYQERGQDDSIDDIDTVTESAVACSVSAGRLSTDSSESLPTAPRTGCEAVSCRPRRSKVPRINNIKSTTALILESRPSGLPGKTEAEERKHRKMYDDLVRNRKLREHQEEEHRRIQLEKQWKHEEEISNSLQIWNREILPAWDSMKATCRVRELWWNGLPPSVRGKVWQLTIANDLNITPELYEICLVRATERLRLMKESDCDSLKSFSESSASRESSVDVIRLDVSRTFPHLGIFQRGGPYHDLLHGLLGAYACYRPDVGYVQGMSFIAGVLLLNMEVNDAFVCFANLLNRPCQNAFFRLDESLMRGYFKTYEEFLQANCPRLFVHFRQQSLTCDLYLIDWVFTLFAKSLSLDVTSRVWDVFFRDGEQFLFRTAIGILKLYEDILVKLDFMQLAEFLTRLPSDLSVDDLFRAIESVSLQLNKRSFADVLAMCMAAR